jgi:hypothetical protein
MSKALDRYHGLRKEGLEYLGGCCVICGRTDDLEFDHIDPATKIRPVSNIYNSAAFWVEVNKCQLLCKEHHREKTAQEIRIRQTKDRNQLHGTISQYYRYRCRCAACKSCYSEYKKILRIRASDEIGST